MVALLARMFRADLLQPPWSFSLYSFQGSYSASLDGEELFRNEQDSNWSKKSHGFRVQSSSNPLPLDPKTLTCAANEKKVRVEIKTDNYGQDTR